MEKAENEKPLFRTCVWFNSGRQNLQKRVETWHQSLPKSSADGTQGRKNGAKMVPTWSQKPPKMGAVRWGTPLPRGDCGVLQMKHTFLRCFEGPANPPRGDDSAPRRPRMQPRGSQTPPRRSNTPKNALRRP